MYPVTCQWSRFTRPTEIRSEIGGLDHPEAQQGGRLDTSSEPKLYFDRGPLKMLWRGTGSAFCPGRKYQIEQNLFFHFWWDLASQMSFSQTEKKGGLQRDLARIYSVSTVSFLPLRESTLLLHTRCMFSFGILSNLWGEEKERMEKGFGGEKKTKTSINLQKNSSKVRVTAGRAGIRMFEGQGQEKKQRAPFVLFVFWYIYGEERALHLVLFSGRAPKKARYHVLSTIMASKMVFFQHGRPCRPQRATCTHTVDVRKLTLRYSLHFPSLSSSVPLPGTMTHKGRQFKSVSFPRDFPHLDNVIHNHAAVWSWGEIKARILNVLQRVMVSVFHVAHMLAAIWELHPKKKTKKEKISGSNCGSFSVAA